MDNRKRLATCIAAVLLLLALTVYNAMTINPHDIKVREESIVSSKIDRDLDGTLIVFFSDLHYGHNFKEEDLDKLIEKISVFDPDIIIFGGDLLSTAETGDNEYLALKLKELNATYGKYAVLGDEDHLSDLSESILRESNFTILNNSSEKIYISGSFINLIGIDSLVNGAPDIGLAYEGVNPSYYSFVISHCPDICKELQLDKSDYILTQLVKNPPAIRETRI